MLVISLLTLIELILSCSKEENVLVLLEYQGLFTEYTVEYTI